MYAKQARWWEEAHRGLARMMQPPPPLLLRMGLRLRLLVCEKLRLAPLTDGRTVWD